MPGLNWVVCLVELRGATRVSHNTQRAVAPSRLYSSDVLESRACGHEDTYRYMCCDAEYFISATRTDPPALQVYRIMTSTRRTALS